MVTLPGGGESEYNTDHFGRKTTDEVKFAGGYLTRKYTYQPGQVTAEHIQHKKVQSEATTRLVDTITYSSSYTGTELVPNSLHGRVIRYTYDGEQRITQVTDSVEGNTQYTYNELGQLTWEGKDNEETTVAYDAYGNIESKGGKTYTYSSTYKDRLIAYDGEAIEYSGTSPNPTVYRGWELTWNKGGQLASASKEGKTIEFTYNIGNVRTQRREEGRKYRYIVDGTRIMRDEYNGVDYLYDSEGKVCGMVYDGETYYFAKNLQGDVISITRDSGWEIARYSYDAWGKCTITTMTAAPEWEKVAEVNVYRYRSYVYDNELGLYYLHNRYYDPEVGRFISEDPARNGTNWYAYCGSDAVNYVDPEGLWRRVGLGYEAQEGDTLWGLAEQLFGNGAYWRDLGYPYDLGSRPLQVGDIIGYEGGLIEYDAKGVPYANASMVIFENNAYHEAKRMPEPAERPAPAPPKPTASGGTSTTSNSKSSGSVSSTSGPGNTTTGVSTSSGEFKLGGGQTHGFGAGRNETPLDFYGPQLPPVYVQPVKESIINGEGGSFSGVLHTADAILDALPDVDTAVAGAYLLDLKKIGDTYHAEFDCWQSKFGYNDLYDFFFDLGTSMDSAKFIFKSGKKEYALWAWKGDYINMGAGAEMGIYERATFLGLKLPQWNVNKDLAMKMSLRVLYRGYTIINYAPREKQWWITGFNPNYKNVSAGQLTAIYTVTFNTKKMYEDFYDKWGKGKKKDSRWSFDGKRTATFRF